MIENTCKKCRRIGEKLFLKGERCLDQKCAMIRRPYPPGLHGKNKRRRISEYGQQLLEKQRLRLMYGVSEKQFKNYIKNVIKQRGEKDILLLAHLEARLDNVVFRLGWAKSRKLARQLVGHGHILVNKRKVDIPSFQVKKGYELKVREKSQKSLLFQSVLPEFKKREFPAWLASGKEKFGGQVISQPEIENVNQVGKIGMIIEYYSR